MTMSASVSILSETTKDELETEDKELGDLVWSLMSRSGLLSEMQGRISKFIEDHGKAENIHVIPDRADPRLLLLIFEYLQWVGMKQTNSVLLSESPVEVDLSMYEARSREADYKPALCSYCEERNETEEDGDRMTPSQNYSKDEFDDSKLTSFSGHPSAKVNEEEEVEDLASDNVEEEEESRGASFKKSPNNSSEDAKSASKHSEPELEKKDSVEEKAVAIENTLEEEPINISTPRPLAGGEDRNHLLIDFNSPGPKVVDQARPNVTVRQPVELNTNTHTEDPFQSPRNMRLEHIPNVSIPVVSSSNRLEFVQQPFSSLNRVGDAENPTKEDEKTEGAGDNIFQVVNEKVSEKETMPMPKQEQKSVNSKELSGASPEEDSTSDFMETLTMEEDTQDVSIPSDTKGMSSCEHAVNLK